MRTASPRSIPTIKMVLGITCGGRVAHAMIEIIKKKTRITIKRCSNAW